MTFWNFVGQGGVPFEIPPELPPLPEVPPDDRTDFYSQMLTVRGLVMDSIGRSVCSVGGSESGGCRFDFFLDGATGGVGVRVFTETPEDGVQNVEEFVFPVMAFDDDNNPEFVGDDFTPNPLFRGGGGSPTLAGCELARQLTNFPGLPKTNGMISAVSVNLPTGGNIDVFTFPVVGAPQAALAFRDIVFKINSVGFLPQPGLPLPDLVAGVATYNGVLGTLDVDLRVLGAGQDLGRITQRYFWEANASAQCGQLIGEAETVTFSLLGDNQQPPRGCDCETVLTGIKDAINRLADRLDNNSRAVERIPNIMLRALPPLLFWPFVYRNFMRAIQGGLSNIVKVLELFLKILVFRPGDPFEITTLTNADVEIPDADGALRVIDENAPLNGQQDAFNQNRLNLSLSGVEVPPRAVFQDGLLDEPRAVAIVTVTGVSRNLRETLFDGDVAVVRFGSVAFVDAAGARGNPYFVSASRQVFESNLPDAVGVVLFPQSGVTMTAQFLGIGD